MTNELPRATRYPLIAAAEIVELRTSATINARTSDLSLDGCYLDTLNPLPPGADVRLQITYEGDTFTTLCTVAHCASNMGMGTKFKSVRQDQQKVLQRWVDHLSGNDSQHVHVPLFRSCHSPQLCPPMISTPKTTPFGFRRAYVVQTRRHVIGQGFLRTALIRHRFSKIQIDCRRCLLTYLVSTSS